MILKLYILITLMFYLFCKNKNKALGLLLLISVVNVITTDILKYFDRDIFFNNNLYVFLHSLIWLISIKKAGANKRFNTAIIICFIAFNFYSYAYSTIFTKFNYDVFVVGALSYISIFTIESYLKLQKEELSFFQSNNYLFLSAPILFFLGMSFMFCFKSNAVTSTVVFSDVKLFTFITYFVNVIYYGLIILYIYKEKK